MSRLRAEEKRAPSAPDTGVLERTRTRTRTDKKLQRPQMYKVLFHNDHFTTREFVVAVLMSVFHKSETDAQQIMLHVHHNGVGVAGVYTYEVAETRIKKVEELARANEYPLRLSMEPAED